MIDYYNKVRHDLLSIGPPLSGRCLDVGCGDGSTGEYLLSEGRCSEVFGVELSESMAEVARGRLTGVVTVDLNLRDYSDIASLGKFDSITMGDVLEHLADPDELLRTLVSDSLLPGGSVLISVPNIRSAEVLVPLVLGDFEYRDSGVLDRTHLRFFTLKSATRMIEAAGLEVVAYGSTQPPTENPAMRLALRAIGSFGVRQHLFGCRKPDSS